MSMILEQVFFTFASDSLIESWKKRLLIIVINTETKHHIKYATLINDLRLYNRDKEIILRIKITDITTKVFRSDRNFERGHYLEWYIISELSIKDHQQWKWRRSYVINHITY